jgi:hypothetical protein
MKKDAEANAKINTTYDAWVNFYKTLGKEFGIYKFLDWLSDCIK